MTRIGKLADGKKRPLLVTFNSEVEKDNVFGNLQALKGIDTYKGVSICEDLTPDQRKEFKDLLNEAKQRNQNETGEFWRVRGSSKNGFFLKKIMAINPQSQ